MPRKTKDSNQEKSTLKSLLFPKKATTSVETTSPNKVSTKKSETSQNKSSKKDSTEARKTTSKKTTTTKKANASAAAETTEKSKKTTTKKATTKKSVSSTKKSATSRSAKKASSKSVSSQSKSTTKSKKELANYSPEYYDLPYQYNQTVVKILAQTPTNLFVYWEISDDDRENLKQKYGKYFFEITKPVLVVYNETLNYSFEVDINDFANSWYIHVEDSDCEYKIELGRRPIPINYHYIPSYNFEKNGPLKPVETSYIYISSSNDLKMPNDRILFHIPNKIYFRNVKTNEILEKDQKDFPFIAKNNHFIRIYELYEDLYKEEISNHHFDLKNPSSGNPSSGGTSSKFR